MSKLIKFLILISILSGCVPQENNRNKLDTVKRKHICIEHSATIQQYKSCMNEADEVLIDFYMIK